VSGSGSISREPVQLGRFRVTPRPSLAVFPVLLLLAIMAGQLVGPPGFDPVLLFLVPVGIAAWFGPSSAALITALIATACEQYAYDFFPGTEVLLTRAWNGASHFIVYLLFARLLRVVHQDRQRYLRDSQQDFLTGLLNRKALEKRFPAEISRAARKRATLAVGYLDIDEFHQLNQEVGHSEGDRLLHHFATELGEVLRRSDIFARVDGDEFVLILPDSNSAAAEAVGEKVKVVLERLSSRNNVSLTASTGFLILPKPKPFEELSGILEAAKNLSSEVKQDSEHVYKVRAWI